MAKQKIILEEIFIFKNFPILIFFLSFLLPFLLTGKFWYGGLFGRYLVLIAYPLALLLAIMPWPASPTRFAARRGQGGRKIYAILLIILFLTFLPTFWFYQIIKGLN